MASTASVVMFAGAASASTGLYVSATTGNDANPCTSSAPCETIGHAVSVAGPGSIINVLAGTYTEDVTTTTSLGLVGHDAVIDATGFDNGIVLSGSGAAGSSVSGFTVENANNEGILAMGTSNVTIANNTVTNNDQSYVFGPNGGTCSTNPAEADDCGEGLHLMGTQDSVVRGNTVTGNAGGILIDDGGFGLVSVGPASGNLITRNYVHDNAFDCGITLPSHNWPAAFNGPGGNGGVYGNTVADNVSEDNGGAGVLLAAPFPGAVVADNTIVHNTVSGNGLPGVTIHAHSPFQDFSGNAVNNNTMSNNGLFGDSDSGLTTTADMVVLSVVPLKVTVAHNTFSDASYGIFLAAGPGPITLPGLPSDVFSTTAATN